MMSVNFLRFWRYLFFVVYFWKLENLIYIINQLALMQIGLNEAPNHYRITSTFQECKIISIFFEKFIIITTKNTIRLISFLFWSGISFYYIVQFYFLTLEPHERKKWIIFFISMQSFVIISPRNGNNEKKQSNFFFQIQSIYSFTIEGLKYATQIWFKSIKQKQFIYVFMYVWICALYAKIKISHKIECLYIWWFESLFLHYIVLIVHGKQNDEKNSIALNEK